MALARRRPTRSRSADCPHRETIPSARKPFVRSHWTISRTGRPPGLNSSGHCHPTGQTARSSNAQTRSVKHHLRAESAEGTAVMREEPHWVAGVPAEAAKGGRREARREASRRPQASSGRAECRRSVRRRRWMSPSAASSSFEDARGRRLQELATLLAPGFEQFGEAIGLVLIRKGAFPAAAYPGAQFRAR